MRSRASATITSLCNWFPATKELSKTGPICSTKREAMQRLNVQMPENHHHHKRGFHMSRVVEFLETGGRATKMKSLTTLLFKVSEHVAYITLNRPTAGQCGEPGVS